MKENSKNPVIRGEYTGAKNGMYGKGYLIEGEKNGMYGKNHKEETKEKMRKPKSEETKNRMSESRKGKIWVNNGVEQRCVTKEEYAEKYRDYKKGRLTMKENSLKKFTFKDQTVIYGKVIETKALRGHPGFTILLNKVEAMGDILYIKEEIDDIDHDIPSELTSIEEIENMYHEKF